MKSFPKTIEAFCSKGGETDFDSAILFPIGASATYLLASLFDGLKVTGPNSEGEYWLHHTDGETGHGVNLGGGSAAEVIASKLQAALSEQPS